MATSPAATPNPNSPSHTDPGAHARGAVVCVEVMIGVKKKPSSEYGLCCQGVFLMNLVWREGVDMRKSLIFNDKAFGLISC